MIINYENTVEDAVEAHYFRTYGAPEVKKGMVIARCVIAISMIAMLSMTIALQYRSSMLSPFFMLMPFFPVFMALVLPGKFFMQSLIKSQLKQGGKNSVHQLDFGRRTVTIQPDGLFINAYNLGDTRIPWSAIDDVITEKNHLFVRWIGGQLLTIPRRTFTDAAQEAAFLAEIQIRRREAAMPIALAPIGYNGASVLSTQDNPVTTFVSGNVANEAGKVPLAHSPVVPPTSGAPWWSGQTPETIGEAEKTVLKQGRQ